MGNLKMLCACYSSFTWLTYGASSATYYYYYYYLAHYHATEGVTAAWPWKFKENTCTLQYLSWSKFLGWAHTERGIARAGAGTIGTRVNALFLSVDETDISVTRRVLFFLGIWVEADTLVLQSGEINVGWILRGDKATLVTL